jgi:hypothetical protein
MALLPWLGLGTIIIACTFVLTYKSPLAETDGCGTEIRGDEGGVAPTGAQQKLGML